MKHTVEGMGVPGAQMHEEFDDLYSKEDDYWRSRYNTQPYVGEEAKWEHWKPAFRYGYMQRSTRARKENWESVESELEQGWESLQKATGLTWQQAKDAVRDAWHRVEDNLPGDADGDGR